MYQSRIKYFKMFTFWRRKNNRIKSWMFWRIKQSKQNFGLLQTKMWGIWWSNCVEEGTFK